MAMPYYPPPPPVRVSPIVAPGPAPWLINECRIEGEKCFVVAYKLDGLGQAIPPQYTAGLIATAEEARALGDKLRALSESSYRHFQRVDLMINYLNVVLPSIKKSLTDVTAHYEDRSKSRELRWRTMYHTMTDEAGNIPLPQRFTLYNAYLDRLLQLLVRDAHFDDNRFQQDRDRILTLRGQQKLPAPTDLAPLRRNSSTNQQLQLTGAAERVPWAQEIFSRPLPSRTVLKQKIHSEAWGPFAPNGKVPVLPPSSKLLFEREFDEGAISVAVYMDRIRKAPFLLLTKRQVGGIWYAQIGAHELGIKRNHSSLELRRWSRSENRPVHWAVLPFRTWEDLVLFYCAFLSLKCNSSLSLKANPDEFAMMGEKRLFQAKILEDDYNHSLIVYKDKYTKGWRLHAAVWDGELRQAPMWTAFISGLCQKPGFLKKRSSRRVWLNNLDIYSFSDEYQPDGQRHGKTGSYFEIKFDSEPGARHFVELFQPSSESTEPSEATASTVDSDDEHSATNDRDAAATAGDGTRAQVTASSASTSTSALTSATTSSRSSAAASEDDQSSVERRRNRRRRRRRSRSHDDEDEDEDDRRRSNVSETESSEGDGDRREAGGYSEAASEIMNSGASDEGEDEDRSRSGNRNRQRRRTGSSGYRLADYVDYIGPDDISVEEVVSDDDDGKDDSSEEEDEDMSSDFGGASDGDTLKIGPGKGERRESLLSTPPDELEIQELDIDMEMGRLNLEGPEELSRLEAPREPAKITDGRPPKPFVEDCSDDGT